MIAFALIAGGLILAFMRYQKNLLAKQGELHRLDIRYKKDLLKNSIQSAEDERIRIAKDIHDELGSIFSTLSLSINQISSENTSNTQHFQNCKSLVQTGIASVRRISHAIIPFEISILGLEQALENHFEVINSASVITMNLETNFNLEELSESAALAVYRIVQELSSNSIKYADAKKLLLTINRDVQTDTISFFYKDDGKGADPNSIRSKNGIGLKNIEGRAIAMDGEAVFESAPGAGFQCCITLPFIKNTKLC